MDKIKYILIYFLLINLISFIMFYLDKEKAKKDKWRIEEKTLHTASFLGGVLGSITAMRLFHHKTKKKSFKAITLLALLFNVLIYYYLITKLITG